MEGAVIYISTRPTHSTQTAKGYGENYKKLNFL
ncbi:hypothetical protein CULC809_01876 [Corynebacterium ulcerans 809]|nr:hypothetical protein CULC809_01876 [Corynebacterium ulcerans 809]